MVTSNGSCAITTSFNTAMKPLPVKVFVESNSAHTTQFYSGLYMLQDQGFVKLSLASGRYNQSASIRLEVNNKKIYIDLEDHFFINKKVYADQQLYFKRMLLKGDAKQLLKLHPYGLNYAVYYKYDETFRRSFFSKDWRNIANAFARSNTIISSLFNINLAHHTARVQHFEQPHVECSHPKVIFSAKLWLPEKPKTIEKQRQRRFINDQRIQIVKEGRKRLGKNFTGGIAISEYARKIAPEELVRNNLYSHKSSYLETLRSACIAIATTGLEDSIGFKFAEYVCMSKAIVSSPIDQYLLPGDFANNHNYIAFDNSAEDCINKCEQLMQDKALLLHLMQNNHQYYQQYLRPDKLAWNILKLAADV
jgi:hypothetical protein